MNEIMLCLGPWQYSDDLSYLILERYCLSHLGSGFYIYVAFDLFRPYDGWSFHSNILDINELYFKDVNILKTLLEIDLRLIDIDVEIEQPFIYPKEFLEDDIFETMA